MAKVDKQVGSPEMGSLCANSKAFLSEYPVTCSKVVDQALLGELIPGTVSQFKIVDSRAMGQGAVQGGKTCYFLRYDSRVEDAESRARNARPAYYLGYHGAHQEAKNPAHVDVWKKPDTKDLALMVFTGMLSGCSFIVTSLNDTHFRVFHDGRVNSSDLYDRVVAAVDYRDYEGGVGNTATVLMQYSLVDERWSVHVQGLATAGRVTASRVTEVYTLRDLGDGQAVQTIPIDPGEAPREWKAEEGIEKVSAKRRQTLVELKQIVDEYRGRGLQEPLGNPTDEPFVLPARSQNPLPKLDNPAVRATQTYVKILREFAAKIRLVQEGHDNLGLTITNKEASRIMNRVKAIVSDCDDLDRLYLWQHIRRDAGEAAVIDTGDPLRAHLPGDSLGEQFDVLERRVQMAPTADIREGYTDVRNAQEPATGPSSAAQLGSGPTPSTSHNTSSSPFKSTRLAVTRPASGGDSRESNASHVSTSLATETATLFELKTTCVSQLSKLTDKELGSLVRRIEDAARKERLGWLEDAPQVIQNLLTMGGRDVRPMPLDVMYRLVGSGYCYALVRVVSAAVWAEDVLAVDQFLSKLASLRTSTMDGSPEARLLIRGLQELRGNVDALTALELLGCMTLDKVMNHLLIEPGTACQLLALNTQTHSMLLCATVRKSSYTESDYHFYDPNFGMVTYSSAQDLLEALKRHLLEGGFAETYNAYGTREQPVFSLYEIDGAALSQIDVDSGLVAQDLGNEQPLWEAMGPMPTNSRGAQDPGTAARELLDDPAFRRTVMAGTAVTASTWNGPWTWEGKPLIRVPEDNVLSMYAGMYGLQLDDGERPGFSPSS